ncbi:MAG: hypothetical protein GZ086_10570 [Gelidibacter sp.]|nr:hypothetical protein [Gelidibacter sp.]
MNSDEIKLYLPKFLSSESERQLFEGLKDFPKNIDERLYTSALKESSIIFQGDGIKDMLVINLPNTSIKEAKSIVFSNTCDMAPNNIRNFPSQIVYAPIFNLQKYKQALIEKSSKSKKEISSHIKAIKEQKITQIFYLPKINDKIEDSIIFLDRVNNCSQEYLQSKELKQDRLFTLSDYGAYLFVFKLSIHFSRIKDNVDRIAGKV